MKRYLGFVLSLLFLLSTTALAAEAGLGLKDGSYKVKLQMEGGSGRASVEEDTSMDINNGQAAVRVVWSSPNYDYMVVDGVTYYPVNSEGNSEFRIPVSVLDESFTVIGDTVAMSQPHEIEYQFTVSLVDDSKQKIVAYAIAAFLLVLIVIYQYNKNTKPIIQDAKNE